MSARSAPTDAAVLVGHATRLPGKFDLVVQGSSVLERVLSAVRGAGFRPTIVAVPESGRSGPSVLVDRYDHGPLGAVRTYLETRSGPFLLVGGDMPFVRVEDLRALADRFLPGRSVVPRRPDGRFEVLLAIYDLPLEEVRRSWTAGRSLQQLVAAADARGEVCAVPVEELDPRSFLDLDTPADFARWRDPPVPGVDGDPTR